MNKTSFVALKYINGITNYIKKKNPSTNNVIELINEINLVHSDLSLCCDIFLNDKILHLLHNTSFVKSDKYLDIIKYLQEKQINNFTISLIQLLIKRKKIFLLQEIQNIMTNKIRDLSQEKLCIIESNTLFTEEQIDKFRQNIQVNCKMKIIIKNIINESIVFGVRIHIDSYIYDSSNEALMNTLRCELSDKISALYI